MPTVAQQLRSGREAMNFSIAQVVEVTKLKADQIHALEEGNYESFSAGVYLRGSVRTYAKILKLDAAELVAQLDTELGSSKKFADDLPAAPRKRGGVDSLMLLLSRLNWGVAVVVIVLLAVVLGGNAAYRGWKNRKASDPLKKLGGGMYQPAAGGETLPLPTNISTNLRSR
ncbi:MAG TPA: helix-turn-helix transcriptional regulator [Verrucomicrobiae bacterium]|jgi:cytoskeleton protein RodZ